MAGHSKFIGDVDSSISQDGIDELDNLLTLCLAVKHINKSNAIDQINKQRKKRKQIPLYIDACSPEVEKMP